MLKDSPLFSYLYTEERKAMRIVRKEYEMDVVKAGKNHFYVHHIFIHPQYRHQGLLRKIFEGFCKEKDCWLSWEAHENLVPMYEHIGAVCLGPCGSDFYDLNYDPLKRK